MLDVMLHNPTRRNFLRLGALGLGGLTLANFLQLKAQGQTRPSAPARSVIQLWMGGGPCHIDTFDPKPEAGEEYCGPYKRPIPTNVTGIRVCETLPLLAKQADKFSIIRSLIHPSNGHETATYIVQTGSLPSDQLVYPAIGAVVALKRATEGGYSGALPPYITLTSALGRFSEAGFLGPDYQTFATGGEPTGKEFAVQGLVPVRGMTEARLKQRRELLQSVDALAGQGDDPTLKAMDAYQQKAYSLILGQAKAAFDIAQEKDDLREKYGRNRFGQSCLLARRLVEHGVPFITVNFPGWDTHTKHFEAMARLLPQLDQGFAALLEDLAQRGLLQSTIVVWYGEFGRTPKVAPEAPWFGGRHHFANVFSAVVAGGGFKGGQVVGSSDWRGERVRERPVYPWDLSASMYHLMGIDPMGKLPHPQGCTAYVTPLARGEVASGGLLKEIM